MQTDTGNQETDEQDEGLNSKARAVHSECVEKVKAAMMTYIKYHIKTNVFTSQTIFDAMKNKKKFIFAKKKASSKVR